MGPHSSTLSWKIPWMEKPGGLQSMGSLRVGTTERLHFHFSLSHIGEGNGNPLQCSCLENPRDGGAWWATISGVAQSQTRLKQLSSSSSRHHLYITTRSHLPLLYIAAIIISIILHHQNHHSPPHYCHPVITTIVIFTSLSSPFFKFLVTFSTWSIFEEFSEVPFRPSLPKQVRFCLFREIIRFIQSTRRQGFSSVGELNSLHCFKLVE